MSGAWPAAAKGAGARTCVRVSTGTSGLSVTIDVPFPLQSLSDAQLDLCATSVRLLAPAREVGAPGEELHVPLPAGLALDADRAVAKYSRKRRQLVVSAPSLAYGVGVAGSLPGPACLEDLFAEGGCRGRGRLSPGLCVRDGALPAALAREARDFLLRQPAEAWQLADTRSQPLPDGSGSISMRFRRLQADTSAAQTLKARVAAALAEVLAPGPSEQLLINFSKYETDDHLDSHPDVPSGSRGYERREAFVWHLSDTWAASDGGVFIDEEAAGGPMQLVPTFNALVTFPVPRWHSVTKITGARRGQQARFAAYGWVVAPTVERLGGVAWRAHVLGAPGRAAAVLCVRNAAQIDAKTVANVYGSLPLEKLGSHMLGELCTFAATEDPVLIRALGVERTMETALVVIADPAGTLLHALADVLPSTARCILADDRQLQSLVDVRMFVDEARKVYSPCPELCLANSLRMVDVWFSHEVKVFLFLPLGARDASLLARLGEWALALRPRLRIFLADPGASAPFMADFGLSAADAPTAAALDTHGPLGRALLRDHLPSGVVGLDVAFLRQWIGCVAEAAGCRRPALR